jgi:hypothetical protein
LIASMITIIFITSMTENMLSNLLLFGSVPMIISNVVVQTIAND